MYLSKSIIYHIHVVLRKSFNCYAINEFFLRIRFFILHLSNRKDNKVREILTYNLYVQIKRLFQKEGHLQFGYRKCIIVQHIFDANYQSRKRILKQYTHSQIFK